MKARAGSEKNTRVGKGALAPCPPSFSRVVWWARGACHRGAHSRDPLALPTYNAAPSHRRDVLSVLHRQDDPRAVVEAVAVFFGPVVDALARDDFLFADEGLPDSLAEFGRPRLAGFQRHRNDAL